MYDDKVKRYTRTQVYGMIAQAVEATWYFESDAFSMEYLNMYNNWPEPEQIADAEDKFIENWIVYSEA